MRPIETSGSTPPAPPSTPDEIRADIQRTRAELGDTVQALAAKADVKTRARSAVRQAEVQARRTVNEAAEEVAKLPGKVAEGAQRVPAWVGGVAAALAVGALALVLIVRRRTSTTQVRAKHHRGRVLRR